MSNFSFQTDIDFEDGSVINKANFTQANPNTVLTNLVGKNITFENCNMGNVNIDANWTIIGGGQIQIDRCTNLNPDYIDRGVVECVENCSHVIDTDEIDIDGVIITIYHYKDSRV